MSALHKLMAGLLVSAILAGCVWVPDRQGGGSFWVPVLPPVVELGPEPYYVYKGCHYYYRDGGWYYSRSGRGPWVVLPRDHYPREVRYRGYGPHRAPERPSGSHGRPPAPGGSGSGYRGR